MDTWTQDLYRLVNLLAYSQEIPDDTDPLLMAAARLYLKWEFASVNPMVANFLSKNYGHGN